MPRKTAKKTATTLQQFLRKASQDNMADRASSGWVIGDPPDKSTRPPGAVERLYGPEYIRQLEKARDTGGLYGFREEVVGPVADELGGYPSAAIDWLYGQITGNPQPWDELRDERLATMRQAQQQYRTEHPAASIGANVVGALTATPSKAAAAAPGLWQGVKSGAKVGAGWGGAIGFAEGEGGLGNRLESAAVGAAVGAPLGVLAPLGVEAASRLIQGAKNIAGLKGAGATNRARTMVIEALKRDGFSLHDLVARARTGKPITIADLGPNARELIGAASRKGGEGKAAVEKFLTDRSRESFARIEGDLASGVGENARNFYAETARLAQEKAKASPLYQRLYGQTVKAEGKLRELLARPALRSALAKAQKWWANKGNEMPKDGSIPFEVLDQAKKELDYVIGWGKTPEGSAKVGNIGTLKVLQKEFLDVADNLFPGYRLARNTSADPQQALKALEAGRKFLSEDAEMVAGALAEMNPVEQSLFRLGAARALRDKLARQGFTTDTARMFDNPRMQELVREIFPDQAGFDTFMRAVADERLMQESFDKILRNSATAGRQIADQEFDQNALGLGDAAVDALRGRGLVSTSIDWALKAGKAAEDRIVHGLNSRVGAEIGDLATRTDLGDVALRLAATPGRNVPALVNGVPQPPALPALASGRAADLVMPPPREEPVTPGATGGWVIGEPTGVTPAAEQALAALEQRWGRPLGVNSAYRSPEKNASVGGAKQSRHMSGDAFDIDVSGMSLDERRLLLNMASEAGFGGLGVYDNAIHLDLGARRAWGPSHHSDSIPKWAAPVIARHMSRAK